MGTELERARTFDLTRSPDEQWNEEMLALVAATVLKGSATRSEQVFCLAVADSLNLNPFIDEIYFIKVKSRDGAGKVFKPYIGRNGLVAKATERNAYYKSGAVHENDLFEVETTSTGRTKMRHKYGAKDRGPVIGAYAFLYGPWAIPGFAYIDIEEYRPTFDAEWKEDASPWYNQISTMAQKCAMIVAGRERLQLGNVLADGEIERVVQQTEAGPARRTLAEGTPAEFDYGKLGTQIKSDSLATALREAVEEVNELKPEAWTPAKLEMVTAGMDAGDVSALIQRIDQEINTVRRSRSPVAPTAHDQSPAEGARSPGGERVAVTGEVIDREPLSPEEIERVAVLQQRIGEMTDELRAVEDEGQREQLEEEIERCGTELAAIGNPAQSSLL